MNSAILLTISMVATVATTMIKKQYSLMFPHTPYYRYAYNFICASVSALFFLCIGGSFRVSPMTFWLAVLFGSITTLQQIFNLKAVEIGPLSYTHVIISLSMLIPTFVGSLFWHETVAPMQYLGLVLMIACIFLSTDFRKKEGKANLKWLLYTGITFFCTGAIGITQKVHQTSPVKGELTDFLFLSFLVGAVLSGFLMLTSRETKEKPMPVSRLWFPAILLIVKGLCAGLNNRINLYLSGVMDSAVFYPVNNGGTLILTAIAAVILYRERLLKKQWLGIVIGILAVVCLCNPF